MTQPNISEGWVANEVVTAEKLNRFTKDMFDWLMSHREPRSYTPQLLASSVDPSLGTGATAVGWYWIDPLTHWISGHFLFVFGSSGASFGAGTYQVTMPTAVRAFSSGSIGQGDQWGNCQVRDTNATDNSRKGLITRASVNGGPGGVGLGNLVLLEGPGLRDVTPTTPFTFAAGDGIAGYFHYPGVL